MKTVEMTMKDLEHNIKLSWTEFERTDSSVERGATVDRLLSNSCVC